MSDIRFFFNKNFTILELIAGREMCPDDLLKESGFCKTKIYDIVRELGKNGLIEVTRCEGLTNYWSVTDRGMEIVEFVRNYDSDDITYSPAQVKKETIKPDKNDNDLEYQSDANMFYQEKNKENVAQIFWMMYMKRDNKPLVYANAKDRAFIRSTFNENGLYKKYDKFEEHRAYSDDELYDLYKIYLNRVLKLI